MTLLTETNIHATFNFVQIPYHEKELSDWLNSAKGNYSQVSYIDPLQGVKEADARKQAM